MKFVIHGKHVEVTDALRNYIEEKLGKAEKHSRHILEVNVELSVAKNPRIKNNQQVNVTTSVNGLMLRAEESSVNMYAAIDLVADKLERQLKKYESKRTEKPHVKTSVAMSGPLDPDEVEGDGDGSRRRIRNERLAIKPMSPEEAAAQMELLNYNFLLFRNQESNVLNIIYRLDGKAQSYGLIIPDESVDEAVVMKL
ncbi:MAG: ribosomal subunit interface protein [Candidatus Melainabacteria bacterium HGW-Melainabacteria-1]|nr:MAG: ribosomal subunit interface protein [Candidatus Melainabacteria bacterium HGW-Melainabacteria-1]